MLDAGDKRILVPWARWLLVGMRLVGGYVLAVAVGSLVYASIGALTPGFNFRPDPSSYGPVADLFIAAFMYFVMGGLFGLPFLAVGMLCPAAAILLLILSVDGGRGLGTNVLFFMAITLPAGLAAAYVYGAIGFGYGFRRWRLG